MGTIFLMNEKKKKRHFNSFTCITSCWKRVNHAVQYIHYPITQKGHIFYMLGRYYPKSRQISCPSFLHDALLTS